MRYIGDIHGRYDLYNRAVQGCDSSIQVGDFGMGFIPNDALELWPGGAGSGHFFIRGNHDNPATAFAHPQHIASGARGERFFLGGGWSIDAEWRVPGVSWWTDEEHSVSELGALLENYADAKPQVMVSHEGPATICAMLFHAEYPPGPSRTALCLDAMLSAHQPDLWVFGHWHQRRDKIIDRTRFICLEEGGWIDL